jgi:hypothetical protein
VKGAGRNQLKVQPRRQVNCGPAANGLLETPSFDCARVVIGGVFRLIACYSLEERYGRIRLRASWLNALTIIETPGAPFENANIAIRWVGDSELASVVCVICHHESFGLCVRHGDDVGNSVGIKPNLTISMNVTFHVRGSSTTVRVDGHCLINLADVPENRGIAETIHCRLVIKKNPSIGNDATAIPVASSERGKILVIVITTSMRVISRGDVVVLVADLAVDLPVTDLVDLTGFADVLFWEAGLVSSASSCFSPCLSVYMVTPCAVPPSW